jgi:hypothetical protein
MRKGATLFLRSRSRRRLGAVQRRAARWRGHLAAELAEHRNIRSRGARRVRACAGLPGIHPYDYWRMTSLNSTVYRVDLGLQILPRHIIYGEIYAGYLVQNFSSSSFGSTSAPDVGGRLVWDATRLTTLTFTGLRTFIPGKSFGWGIAALHRLDAATKSPSPRRPPHSIFRLLVGRNTN